MGNIRERDHVLLGFVAPTGQPYLLHIPVLFGHGWFAGGTQSGKTSRGLVPLLEQLMLRMFRPGTRKLNKNASSIVLIDLKGDFALLSRLHSVCKELAIPFKMFCPLTNAPSNLFNPFDQEFTKGLSPEERAIALRDALGLQYGGMQYPMGFWSAMNTRPLVAAIRDLELDSFHALHREFQTPAVHQFLELTTDDWSKAQHLRSVVDSLSRLPQLNMTSNNVPHEDAYRERIELTHLVSSEHVPEVLLVVLPVTGQSLLGPLIGRIFLQSLFSAILSLPKSLRKRTWCAMDEWQTIAGESIGVLFEQAAGLGISYLLSNQDYFSLNPQLMEIVSTNVHFRQLFRANSDKMRDWVQKRGGTTIRDYFTYGRSASTGSGISRSWTWKEQTEPYYTDIDVMSQSADPSLSWVECSVNSGFTQFAGQLVPVISEFHITEEEYKTNSKQGWPDLGRAAIYAGKHHRLLDGPTEPMRAAANPGASPKSGSPGNPIPYDHSAPHAKSKLKELKILPAPEFDALASAAERSLKEQSLRSLAHKKGKKK